MSAFDKVIGYETVKQEFVQICDMIHNRDIYVSLGAKLPKGVLMYGDPGLGKTLMAQCFIEESGLPAYTIRKSKGSADFVSEITKVFRIAKDHAPSIVLLDDMDKFANEDNSHRDAEEYVAVQSAIDEVKGTDVFILATVNDKHKLPRSLTRSGRFDRKIEMSCPSEEDAKNIIQYYLRDKKVAENTNFEDISKMFNYSSCAELETILNEAAIRAAYARKNSITIEDFTEAVLRMEYRVVESNSEISKDELRKIALHEAGHLVVAEVLCKGSIGLASLRAKGGNSGSGFVRRCKPLKEDFHCAVVSLSGKAAMELYYADRVTSGCSSDIGSAINYIREKINDDGSCGFALMDIETHRSSQMSEGLNVRNEAVVHAELERYLLMAKDILLKNRDFLEKTVDVLLEKETLLYSDIRKIRESCQLTEVYL